MKLCCLIEDDKHSSVGEHLGNAENTLKAIGIKTRTIFGKWRRTGRILKSISKKWNSINQNDIDLVINAIIEDASSSGDNANDY